MHKPMTSKSIYFLMEIMIVLIFFALSAAICLQLLVSANNKSIHGMQLRFAMQEATTVVETIQATHEIPISYETTVEDIPYKINIKVQQGSYNTMRGSVQISSGEDSLLSLPFTYGGPNP